MAFYDFYHTNSYNLYCNNNNSTPILLCFNDTETEIVMPLIIRPINKTKYLDATSPYGYAGPLSSKNDVTEKTIYAFSHALKQFFTEKNIVSGFSRLHPTYHNEFLLKNIGKIQAMNQTVNIDLSQETNIQRQQYSKGLKYNLNKLLKDGFKIIEDSDKTNINKFIKIYNDNMRRVNAKQNYFFDRAYYDMIFNSRDINSKLFFVTKNKLKIAAGIFVFTNNIIQYHLSATRVDYLKNSPISLLIDYIRVYGSENDYKELHLGGGIGSLKDSLFDFKCSFSQSRHEFKTWQYIANTEVYNSLVIESKNEKDTCFFPIYRASE